jgi:hypothetical protein
MNINKPKKKREGLSSFLFYFQTLIFIFSICIDSGAPNKNDTCSFMEYVIQYLINFNRNT